jgi:hypothetical protein
MSKDLKIINLPSPRTYSTKKIFPVEKFYHLVAKKVDPEVNIKETRIDVTKVRINPKNVKEFKKVVRDYIKYKYSYLTGKKLEFQVGMVWLDLGPVEDSSIPVGKCGVELDGLFISKT